LIIFDEPKKSVVGASDGNNYNGQQNIYVTDVASNSDHHVEITTDDVSDDEAPLLQHKKK